MSRSILLRSLAWALLGALVVVTLSPLSLRPVSPLPTQVERGLALAVIGLVFAFAYPRHIWLVATLVAGSILVLELLQFIAPNRHGRLVDLPFKLIGAACGLLAGWLLSHRPKRD